MRFRDLQIAVLITTCLLASSGSVAVADKAAASQLSARLQWIVQAGAHLDDKQRDEIAGHLKKTFLENAAAMRSLQVDQLPLLASAFDTVTSTPAAGDDAYLLWLNSNRWVEDAGLVKQAEIIDVVSKRDGAKVVKARIEGLIQSIWQQQLGEPTFVAQAPVGDIAAIVPAVSRYLDDAQLLQLRNAFLAAFLETTDRMEATSRTDLAKLEVVCKQLGLTDEQWKELVASWLRENPSWREGDAQSLIDWVKWLGRSKSKAGLTARNEVVNWIWSRHLEVVHAEELQPVLSALTSDKLELLEVAGPHLLGQDRLVARRYFSKAIGETNSLRDVSSAQLADLYDALVALGADDAETGQLVTAWIAGNPDWLDGGLRRRLSAIQAVLEMLPPASTYEVKVARRKILDDVWARYLKSGDHLSQLSAPDLARVVRMLGAYYTEAEQQYLGSRMLELFLAQPESLREMSYPEVTSTVNLFHAIGQRDAAANIISYWISDGNNARQLTVYDITQLCKFRSHEFSDEELKLLVQADGVLLQLHNQRRINAKEYALVTRWYAHAKEWELSEKWVNRFYQYLLAGRTKFDDVEIDQVYRFALSIVYRQDYREGAIFPGFPEYGYALATALGTCEREQFSGETDYVNGLVLATPLAYQESRAAVEALYDHQDIWVRNQARQIMTTYYKMVGQLKQHEADLDEQLADSTVNGDHRAEILLARAFAKEVEVWDRAPLAGRKWFDEAREVAQSEEMRFFIVQELLERMMWTRTYAEAEKLVIGSRHQFGASTAGNYFKRMQQEIDRSRGSETARAANLEEQSKLRRLRGQLELLQTQLGIAKKRNKSPEAIAKLEQVIQQTRDEIATRE